MNQHPPPSVQPSQPPSASPATEAGNAANLSSSSRRPPGLQAPAPSLARLVRVELRKAVDTVSGRWLMVVTGVLVLGALAISVVVAPDRGADVHSLITSALVPVALLLPVVGVLLMSGEFSTRSLLTTFTLVPSRGRVVAAKALAAVVLAVAVTVVAGLLAAATAGGLEVTGDPVRWSVGPAVLGQLVVLQVVNVLVGVGFGLLFQNTPVGVIAYLVVPFLVGFLLLVPSLRDLAPWLDLTTGTGPLSLNSVANGRQWVQAACVALVWAGVPSAVGWLRLRHREIA